MTSILIEIPDTLQARFDERVAAGQFSTPKAYVQTLIALDLRRTEIDEMLLEALDAYERGEYTVHKPGDFQRMYAEMKRQRQEAAKP